MKKISQTAILISILSIITLLVGLKILSYNISRIPGGDEMGVIIEAFGVLRLGFAIFSITIIISTLTSQIKKINQLIWQPMLYILCIIMLYWSSWYVFVHREPMEIRSEIKKSQYDELDKLTLKGNKILKNSENKVSNNKYVTKDSVAIVDFFKCFLDRDNISPSLKIDSTYHSTFNHFFNKTLTHLDSIQSLRYRVNISNSLTLDYISISPNSKFIFAIITYDIGQNPTESNALTLIGSREDGKLILYKYPCSRNYSGAFNKKYAFYSLICDLDKGDRPCSKGNPFKLSFWTNGYFQKVKINNTEKYLYQVNELYNQPDKKFDSTPVPNVVIKE